MLQVMNIIRWQRTILPCTNNVIIRLLHKEPIPVEWKKPRIGWTKLNFDGSCKGKNGKASIGGLIRNDKAEFLLGYAESIGLSNSTMAELIALRRGLELVLEYGWNDKLWLEGDAKTLVEIILKRRKVRCMEVQKHISHINSILILPEMNNVFVSHIYREGNRAADKFAQMGHLLEEPTIWRSVPPHEVLSIMDDDAQGKIVLRTRR